LVRANGTAAEAATETAAKAEATADEPYTGVNNLWSRCLEDWRSLRSRRRDVDNRRARLCNRCRRRAGNDLWSRLDDRSGFNELNRFDRFHLDWTKEWLNRNFRGYETWAVDSIVRRYDRRSRNRNRLDLDRRGLNDTKIDSWDDCLNGRLCCCNRFDDLRLHWRTVDDRLLSGRNNRTNRS